MRLSTQRMWLVAAIVIVSTTGSMLAAEQLNGRVYLTGYDLSPWRGDTGQWQVVGDVFVNPQNEKLLSSTPGVGTVLNGPTGRTKHLFSQVEFGDVRAHVEFMVPKGSNSGVYFQGRYEIQVLDSWAVPDERLKHGDCGGIYQRWDNDRKPQGYEGRPPRTNAAREPGQWQTFDVVFRAPRFDANGNKLSNARFEKVVHNGVFVHADVEVSGPTRASAYNDEQPLGPLMLQGDHGPVAYRNVWIEPAGPLPFYAMDTALRDGKYDTPEKMARVLDDLGYAGFGASGCQGMNALLAELDEHDLRLYTTYVGVNIDADQKYDPMLTNAIDAFEGRNTILWLNVRSNTLKASSTDGDDCVKEIIGEIAEKAETKGVRVALYPHTGFLVQTVEDAVRIVKQMKEDARAEKEQLRNVGVTFNLCHYLKVGSDHDLRSLIELAMPHLFVVSINGADKGGNNWEQLIQPLGRGTYDVGAFLEVLGDCGYNGPLAFQGYGIGGSSYENLRQTMQAWLKLAPRMQQ